VAGDVDNVLGTHWLLVGPRRDSLPAALRHALMQAIHAERQSTLLVRMDGPIHDPAWAEHPVSLEDLVLAYLASARKGTRSAKRHLRRLSGKVNRCRRDCDHVLSRRIVDSVGPGTVIVVENRTNIRARVQQRDRESRRRLHSWSFAQLREFLEYKAQEAGCVVVGSTPGPPPLTLLRARSRPHPWRCQHSRTATLRYHRCGAGAGASSPYWPPVRPRP